MALDKTDISLDLVHGADTKVNSQIDTSFQKMINVTFDGDMTAKKMKGYDLLDTLPAGEKYSLLARRQSDLIAQTDHGFYKYLPYFEKFKKISGIGSCEIESNENSGFNIAFSDNYRCAYLSVGAVEKLQFSTHDGVVLNYSYSAIANVISDPRVISKVVSAGDVFYILRADTIDNSPGVLSFFNISKYVLNNSTYEFEFSGDVFVDISAESIVAMDIFTDGTSLFVSYATATIKKYESYDLNLALILSVNMITTPNKNVEIFQSSDPLYLLIAMSVITGANSATLKLVKVKKSDLTETLVTNIVTKLATGQVGGYVFPIFSTYPTSDTTAVYFSSTQFYRSGSFGEIQNFPTGKIFLSNGRYYIPVLMNNGNNICTVVMTLEELIIDGDSLGYFATNPVAVSDSGQISYDTYLKKYQFPIFAPNPICQHDGKFYFTSINPALNPVMISFDPDAKEKNSYIEIDRKVITSGGLLGYYDGASFAEHGFIGNPNPYRFETSTTGSLPADTGYAFVALYRYEDESGNVFYSPPSRVYSGGDPVNGLTLPANSKVTIYVQQSIITNKSDYFVEIYIRRKNMPFQLCYSLAVDRDNGSLNDTNGIVGFTIDISTYPASTAKVYPYQDGSVAPETTVNSSAIALYSDRVFRISKDNPISLAYSQRKLTGNGFEFNDSFLYLDVLDKRGIAEDNLTGCIAMDGRLIIFKETSILYMSGSGPSRANTQDDFSEPQLLVSDVGCIQPRSIILVPDGVMFKSDKGIYLLNRKLQAGYIGSNVEEFNNYTIVSAILLEVANEVRFATLEGLVLVYNYLSSAWSWFEDLSCISACLFNGKYAILKTDGQVIIETPSHNKLIDQAIIQNISSPWLRLNKIQGYQKAYYVRILGKFKTLHRLKMNVYYDYELYSSEEYIIDPLAENQYNIEIKPTNEEIENGDAINGVYQMKIDLVRKNCQAVRVVIEDIPLDVENNTGECFALSNITVNIGIKKGLAKIQASKSY